MAGYLGSTPVPQATQHRESFTATSGQTTFATAGYTAGFVDVYLNGSHLSPADFTATNGSDVVLASGASADDVCDIISHSAFEVNNGVFTGSATFNEGSADADFRVESNGKANMLFVDGGENAVGINTSSPTTTFQSKGGSVSTPSDNAGLITNASASFIVDHANNYGIYTGYVASANDAVGIAATRTGGTALPLILQPFGGNVGIGTSSPATKVHIAASSYSAPTGGLDGNLNLLINNTQYAGLGLLGASNGTSFIHFGDGDDMDVGKLEYHHADNSMRFTTNTSEAMRISSIGAVTKPLQPAFQVKPASSQNNIAVGSAVTVVFATEIFDQNADFASNTFTAPVTGKYHLDVHLTIGSIDTAADYYQVQLITSNRVYYQTMDFGGYGADPVHGRLSLSVLADMDGSDTVYVGILQSAGSQQTDIGVDSYFSGYLVA